MNEVQKMAMEKEIDEQFAERMGWIKEELSKGCMDTDSTEKVYAQMIVNGINIATKLSAALALDFLDEAGVIELRSEDEIREGIFSVVEREEKG